MIFRQPKLVETILRKAQGMGTEVLEEVTWKLIHGARKGVRSYTNGELDPQHRYLRTEAEKAAQAFATNPVLGPLYQKIVTIETRDVDMHKAEFNDQDDW